MLKIDRPALVTMRNGGTRVADFAFEHPEGACFVDIWWDTPEAMPFHVLDGELKDNGDGTWTVGDCSLRPLTRFDAEWDEWQNWLDYRQGEGGSHLTDEMALEAAARDGAIIT